MTDSFEKFAEDLQKTIIRDARAYYTDKVVDLWLNPVNLGVLGRPKGYAKMTGPCGDTIEIFLDIEGDRIARATFMTDGCGPSVASASMATQLALGKTLQEARAITKQTVLEALGGLPDESKHCALLAAETLAAALGSYQSEGVPDTPTQNAVKNGARRDAQPAETPGEQSH